MLGYFSIYIGPSSGYNGPSQGRHTMNNSPYLDRPLRSKFAVAHDLLSRHEPEGLTDVQWTFVTSELLPNPEGRILIRTLAA